MSFPGSLLPIPPSDSSTDLRLDMESTRAGEEFIHMLENEDTTGSPQIPTQVLDSLKSQGSYTSTGLHLRDHGRGWGVLLLYTLGCFACGRYFYKPQ